MKQCTVTVTVKNSRDYKSPKTASVVVITSKKSGTPMIKEVKVIGNKATVIFSSETEGAIGYDYVILTER